MGELENITVGGVANMVGGIGIGSTSDFNGVIVDWSARRRRRQMRDDRLGWREDRGCGGGAVLLGRRALW